MGSSGHFEEHRRSSGDRAEQDRSLARHHLAAFAAHEFRGPIHTLQAFLSILIREQSGPLNEIQRDFISSMLFITRRLERLTDDIQVLFAEGDVFPVNHQPVDQLSLAEDCLRELSPISEGFTVPIEIQADRTKNWTTLSDPVRLTQIMVNLLENAVRNTVSGTPVVMRLRQSLTRTLLVVENRAVTPPTGSIEDWFEPYFRGRTANERSPRGRGLGLTIVSHLVATLEGHILTRTREQVVTIAVCLPRATVGDVQNQ